AQQAFRAEAKSAADAAAQKAGTGQQAFAAETGRLCEELESSLEAKKEKAVAAVMNLIAQQ
ncbi:MAG TPA: hypothetical protein DEB31_08625, partial [Clostridiales bacterium]|nr:hypothetical protein [Clostridiales bacterium]